MAYTQPKIRNIEKDIKVFAWSDITKALKKIVQKYHPDGGVQLGDPISTSQPSSSESLPTQRSFTDDYTLQPFTGEPQFHQDFGYIGPPVFESGSSRSTSISPQSATSQLVVPTAEYARSGEYGVESTGNYITGQQTFGFMDNEPQEF